MEDGPRVQKLDKGKQKKRDKKAGKKKKKKKEKHVKKRTKKDHKRKRRKASSGSSTASSSTSSSLIVLCTERELQSALERGHIIFVQRAFEKHGASWQGEAGNSFLHLAVRANTPDLVSWILSQPRADLDLRNIRGETALLLAAKLFRGNIARQLVESMADPGAADLEGETPEAFDLDGLLDEAERSEAASRKAWREHLVSHVTAARQRREEAEWRERLFFETGLEDPEPFAGYEEAERRDLLSGGRDWADDIAAQAQAKAQAVRRAQAEQRLRAVLEAKRQARLQAEEAARNAQAREEQQRRDAAAAPASTGPQPDEEEAEEVRISARARDDARWQAFEGRLASAEGISEKDLPWPSGPAENPLFINPAGHPSVIRSQLRAGLLRWHPDKLMQRAGHLLQEKQKDAVLDRVKQISQHLNRLMTELLKGSAAASSQ